MNRRQLILLLCGLAVLVAAYFLREPAAALIERLNGWMRALGPWGPPVFVALCALAVLLFLPVSPFFLAAGVLFGFWQGSLLAAIAHIGGCLIGFLIARTLGRRHLKGWISRSPRFRAIDTAIREGGLRTAFLLRMSPVMPASIQSYAFGFTSLRIRHYLVASIATIPTVMMYVYYGHALGQLTAVDPDAQLAASPTRYALIIAGLLATALATVLLSRRARAELAAHRPAAGDATIGGGTSKPAEPPTHEDAA